MSTVINHNLPAMNTYGKLTKNSTAASKSMEKLSSGLRINRAGDDAAGLAISEKMRGQIRGLDQASANAQDATNMLNTAEGALGTTEDILQRMKELATQAANDTNVKSDRGEIQKEINQLTSEINRIGNTTEFNTQKLLKGDGGTALEGVAGTVTTGMSGGVDAIFGQAKASYTLTSAGKNNDSLSITLNGQKLTINFTDQAGADATKAKDGSMQTNGNETTMTVYVSHDTDASKNLANNGSSIRDALQQMIDSNSSLKGQYTVTGSGAEVSVSAVKGGAYDGTNSSIKGSANFEVSGNLAGTTGSVEGTYTAAVAATGGISLGTAGVGGAAATAGDVYAAYAGKGITINGTALEFYDGSKGAYTGKAQGIDIKGAASAADVAAAIVAQAKVDGVTLGSTGARIDIAAKTGGLAGNDLTSQNGTIQKDFSATFQVGANQGQSMTIELGDARALALGISGSANSSDSATGAKFTNTKVVTNGTTTVNEEAALDVSNHDNATNAIAVIEKAIEQVSAERSKIGAYTNRLEYTIDQVTNTSENISSSESRIRDVDMAKEMMKYQTKNVNMQAAQAMLAQANQAPQNVLSLLR